MTETLEAEASTHLDAGDLAGKTRAELLDLCRARGLKATAWKRERMLAALTGQDDAVPVVRSNVLAGQLEARREERADRSEAVKAREAMLKRTGPCLSKNGCRCEAYEAGLKDAFGWQMCECQHTQWAHAVGEQR